MIDTTDKGIGKSGMKSSALKKYAKRMYLNLEI